MTRPFTKPPTTYATQVELLRSRGMMIDDPADAAFYLQHINYYRLAAYCLPFESDHATHSIKAGTRFGDVLNLYEFDRQLRLLILDAIERVEVSVPAQWAYQIAHRHGPHGHLDPTNFVDRTRWQKDLDALTLEVRRSDERFVAHIRSTYREALPPAWAVCEVMSIGTLSRFYSNLRPMPTRRSIAAVYGLDHALLESWLRHLSYLRNVCAHHSRVWNREFTITPRAPRTKPAALVGAFRPGSRRVYNSFLILAHFLDVASRRRDWQQRLAQLVEERSVPTADMGFPSDWKMQQVWLR